MTTTDTNAVSIRPTPTGAELLGATANARTEPIYLKGEGFELTARQIVYCLAAHLAHYGDLNPHHLDAPPWATDAHLRFDGDLTGWATGRTPAQVALLLARAEQIARAQCALALPDWEALQTLAQALVAHSSDPLPGLGRHRHFHGRHSGPNRRGFRLPGRRHQDNPLAVDGATSNHPFTGRTDQ